VPAILHPFNVNYKL